MSLSTRQRTTVLPMLALLLALGGITAVIASYANDARADVAHGQLVPELARRELPVALDGSVVAHAQVGNRIFVGGDFTQVLLQDGTILDQAYIYAYDINTGQFDLGFQPTLNDPVEALEADDAGDGLYVGGRFFRWEVDGRAAFPIRLAKLDADGTLDRNFTARASAVVLTIEQVGNDLYVGGDFLTMNNEPISGLARLDATTGAIDTGFNLGLDDSAANGQLVRRVVAHPDGDELFALHYVRETLGETRRAVFKLDISGDTPVLSGWEIPWLDLIGRSNCWNGLRDLAISPDGSFIVIGGQGADNPPTCDSVMRFETAGDEVVPFTWSARMYSSVFSLAVSDVAVYVGGHFCAAPRLGAVYEGGLTSNFTSTANRCDVNDPLESRNPSELDPVNAVFRNQMAALDPDTAQALEWDPGSNNDLGVFDLTLIDRGLLAGQDNDRFSNFQVGRSGFFDFGGEPDTAPPELTVIEPAAGAIVENPVVITGLATDNRDISRIQIRLRNTSTQQWVQADGSLGSEIVDLPAELTQTAIGEFTWELAAPTLPPGNYEVRGFATDTVGQTSPVEHGFVVPGTPVCSVELDADGQPVLSYANFLQDGVSSVFLQRNGAFLATVNAPDGAFTDTSAAPGDHTYVARWRPGGVVNDVACSPSTITVEPPPPLVLTCTATVTNEREVSLTWSEIPGASSYILRETGSFIRNVGNTTSFVVTNPELDAPQTFDIRSFIRGVPNDIVCNTVTVEAPLAPPPPVLTCTATVLADGSVSLDWSEIPGASSYILRETGSFIRNVGNTTSFVVTDPDLGAQTYDLRAWIGGSPNDIVCNTVNVEAPAPPPPPPTPAAPCTAALNADGTVTLSWLPVDGLANGDYIVRVNNRFLANARDNLSFVHTNPSSGTQQYVIRSRPAGTVNDVACNPVSVP